MTDEDTASIYDLGSDPEPAVEQTRPVFEAACDRSDTDARLENLVVAEDEKTGEAFLSPLVSVPFDADSIDAIDSRERFKDALIPVIRSYVPLVDLGTVDYPVEMLVFLRLQETETGELGFLGGVYRIATLWAREHIHGNYSLEQLVGLIFETGTHPESADDVLEGWQPAYDLEWRQLEPRSADEFETNRSYQEWSTDGKDGETNE